MDAIGEAGGAGASAGDAGVRAALGGDRTGDGRVAELAAALGGGARGAVAGPGRSRAGVSARAATAFSSESRRAACRPRQQQLQSIGKLRGRRRPKPLGECHLQLLVTRNEVRYELDNVLLRAFVEKAPQDIEDRPG